MQNLTDLGLMGAVGQNFSLSVIFVITDPDLPIHYATFMGLR